MCAGVCKAEYTELYVTLECNHSFFLTQLKAVEGHRVERILWKGENSRSWLQVLLGAGCKDQRTNGDGLQAISVGDKLPQKKITHQC